MITAGDIIFMMAQNWWLHSIVQGGIICLLPSAYKCMAQSTTQDQRSAQSIAGITLWRLTGMSNNPQLCPSMLACDPHLAHKLV